MARTFQHKLVTLKIGILEEQRNILQTVTAATDKVLSLANDWVRNADEASDDTFEELNCMVEDMILFLSDKYANLPDEFDGFETFNMEEMQKAISSLNINPEKIPGKQSDKDEHSEEAQCLDNCLKTGQECMTNGKQYTEQLTDKQIGTQHAIQTVLKAQSDIEENNQVVQKRIKKQEENTVKHEKQLEKLTVALDNILDNIQVIGTRVGLLETNAVDHIQVSDLQMKCEILEVNSDNVQCKVDDLDSLLQELTSRVEEVSNNQTPVTELKNLQKAEEKINAFEEEWNKSKEEVEKLHNDFVIKNKILCQIVADRLAPLQGLMDIFNTQLDARKNHAKKWDAVYDQMADLHSKFLQHESKFEKQSVGFVVHKSLASRPIPNTVVYFSDIFANFGNHFDPGSGTFTAPVDGLYATSLNINGDKEVTVSLVKQPNGNFLKSLLATDEIILGKVATTVNSITASAFIVADLKADDKLCVKYGHNEKDSNVLEDSTFACFRIGSL